MKRGLELIVFVSGMVLMALEIAGGRLLVFDYGGSVFVWGGIIAVILSGLSIGYYFGGRLADKKPEEKVLSFIILIAGLLILIIPLIYSKLVLLVSGMPLMFAPLIIILLLFFLPSILLGCVSPFAIKLKIKNLVNVGKVSGNLYALATIGSVFGTFLTTFVLILFIPINTIFFILSASLFVIVLVLRKNKKFYAFCLIIFIFIFLFYFIPSSKSDLLEQVDITFESVYGPVRVLDNSNGLRGLYLSGGVMGEIYKNDKMKPVETWNYLTAMENISVFLNAKEVLVLGVGAGILPTRLSEKHFMDVDAVDINKVVLDVAKEYFGLTPSKNLKLYAKDARMFLKEIDKKYDVIAMDTFKYLNGTYIIPPHLTTKEYFGLVKEHLNDEGIFVVMIVKRDDFFKAEYKTINFVFNNVYVFDYGEQILVASDKEIEFSEEMIKKYYDFKSDEEDLIYTDDYAPINFLSL